MAPSCCVALETLVQASVVAIVLAVVAMWVEASPDCVEVSVDGGTSLSLTFDRLAAGTTSSVVE